MAMLLDRRYNPFRDFSEMARSFYGDTLMPEFKTDIRDNGSSFMLEADLPGFKKEDIHLDLSGTTLTVRAERHSEYEDEDKKSGYLRCERTFGSYTRSFDVTGVDTANIKAAYNDGVLSIDLPKEAPLLPESKSIAVE